MLLLLAYGLDNLVFGPCLGGLLGNYIYPTLLWALIIVLLYRLPGVKARARLHLRRLLVWLALMCVFIAMLGAMVQGGMSGFGKSPYDHSPLGILINLLSLGSTLVGTEMARAWLVNRHFSRRPLLGIIILGLAFALYAFPLVKVISLHGKMDILKSVGMTFFPQLAENILATYLASLGGVVPAALYRGGLIALEHLSPILPNANWVPLTLLGTLTPLLGLVVVHQIYREEARQARINEKNGETHLGTVLTSLGGILIIWFFLGLFSYMPRVIISGSMVPTMKIGDIVIVEKIKADQAQVGDVVMYALDKMKVTHRLKAIQESEPGKKMYIIQGDNNESPDDPVMAEQIQGKVVMVIPKLGWITLWMRGGS